MPLMTIDTLKKYVDDCQVRRQIAKNLDYPTEYERESRHIDAAIRVYRLMQEIRTHWNHS